MNILVTGATGFVGKQLTLKLLEYGHSVYAVIRNEKKGEELKSSLPVSLQKQLTIVKGDVSLHHLGVLEQDSTLLKDKIHTVYHIAAYLSFDPNERQKTFDINVGGTKNSLEFAKKINVKRFFHVSTAYTLGEDSFALEVLHPINNTFINHYEESKCHAEHLVFEYKDAFSVSIFRPSIIIGDSNTGEADTNFGLYGILKSFELLKRRIDRKKELQNKQFKFLCSPDTTQNLVPINYVIDVLTTALLHAEKDRIYHIINSRPPTNQVIKDAILGHLGFENVRFVPTSYCGELSKEERVFNEPLKIFHKYLDRHITFDESNTKQLLKNGDVAKLIMDDCMLNRIISTKQNKKDNHLPSLHSCEV